MNKRHILFFVLIFMTASMLFADSDYDVDDTTGLVLVYPGTISGMFGPTPLTIETAYYISDHELTQKEYLKYCPEAFFYEDGSGDNYPAYNVSWYDALVYCNLRSRDVGLTPCYTIKGSTDPADWGIVPRNGNDSDWDAVICNFSADGYRLPTLDEWRYAAAGGEMYWYSGSNNIDEVAWYGEPGGPTARAHEVKLLKENGFHLYDMSGNLSEWVWEELPGEPGCHYVCGGTFVWRDYQCETGSTDGNYAYSGQFKQGFRIVRTDVD